MGTAGGTACNAAPKSSSGAGDINPLDLTAAPGAMVERVSVYDHFVTTHGTAASIALGPGSIVHDSNTARAINDCTSPFATPTQSTCLPGAVAQGLCCYGAAQSFTAPGSNTQPTVNVTTGISANTGNGECLIDGTSARGSTNAIIGGFRTRIDSCRVLPAVASGPGTASGGITVGNFSTVAKTQMLNLVAGATGITVGNDSTALENKIIGSYATGVVASGANATVLRNTMKTTTGAGIVASGASGKVDDNYIEVVRPLVRVL